MNIIKARVFDWNGNLSSRKYVFRVPDYASIKKDTLLVAEKNGGKDGIQVVSAFADSVEVNDEVLDMIMNGKQVISSILGVYELKELKPEEPEEPKPKLTREEKTLLDSFYSDILYVARDYNGEIFLHIHRPTKMGEDGYKEWYSNEEAIRLNNELFKFITHKDDKPWEIGELRKLEVEE